MSGRLQAGGGICKVLVRNFFASRTLLLLAGVLKRSLRFLPVQGDWRRYNAFVERRPFPPTLSSITPRANVEDNCKAQNKRYYRRQQREEKPFVKGRHLHRLAAARRCR